MNPKLIFKSFQSSLKFLLLVSLFFGISNCKYEKDPCDKTSQTFDTSFFEKNEKDLIPDWEGDSLFFYSDAGDTAYLFCKSQGFGYSDDIESWPLPCSYKYYHPYECCWTNYHSNNQELDNLRIVFYKESYLEQRTPPFRQALIIIPKWCNYRLFELDGKTLPNDSVLLANGNYETGWVKEDAFTKTVMNLNVGIIKLENKSGKKWTQFRYTLNN